MGRSKSPLAGLQAAALCGTLLGGRGWAPRASFLELSPSHPDCREMSETLSFLCLPLPAQHTSRGANKHWSPPCLFCDCQEGRLRPGRWGHCQRPLLAGTGGCTEGQGSCQGLALLWAPVGRDSLDSGVIQLGF